MVRYEANGTEVNLDSRSSINWTGAPWRDSKGDIWCQRHQQKECLKRRNRSDLKLWNLMGRPNERQINRKMQMP